MLCAIFDHLSLGLNPTNHIRIFCLLSKWTHSTISFRSYQSLHFIHITSIESGLVDCTRLRLLSHREASTIFLLSIPNIRKRCCSRGICKALLPQSTALFPGFSLAFLEGIIEILDRLATLWFHTAYLLILGSAFSSILRDISPFLLQNPILSC